MRSGGVWWDLVGLMGSLGVTGMGLWVLVYESVKKTSVQKCNHQERVGAQEEGDHKRRYT